MMPIDVSVVIPVYNPGANLDDCLASMLEQTLDPSRFEVILVDDGSTDGSADRIDQWVTRHTSLATVIHLPPSGGPAHPRNVGIERARGRFIQFVDSDDALPPGSLERLVDVAQESDADLVIGKISSDFRGSFQPMFRRTVTGRTLADFPLMRNLTVCKMFRRAFLEQHAIRFPEGPHYIEDQHLCVQAYVHARSVAVVGDTLCYRYQSRRTGGEHYGDTRIVPAAYFAELAAILDILDENLSEAARRPAYSRYYRTEVLGRLRGPAMIEYDDGYRRDIADQVRQIATARFPRDINTAMPMIQRCQSRLMLAEDIDGLLNLARQVDGIGLEATARSVHWEDGRLIVDVDARLLCNQTAFTLERCDDGWGLPSFIAPDVDPTDRLMAAADFEDLDMDLTVVSRVDQSIWSTTEGLQFTVDDDGMPRFHGQVAIDPTTVLGGRRLGSGAWDVRLTVFFAGLKLTSRVRLTGHENQHPGSWIEDDGGALRSIQVVWSAASPNLLLDVDEWSKPLHNLVGATPADLPRISANRELVVPAALIQGPVGTVLDAELAFVSSHSTGPVIRCVGSMVVSPNGTQLRAAVPELPTISEEWSIWLRIGPLGSRRPRRLPMSIRQVDDDSLIVVPQPAD